MQPQSEASVPVQDAYDAARERAARTTEALILAEAQVRALTRERDELLRHGDMLREDIRGLRVEAARLRGEVEDAAESADPVGYTKAVGQAD